MATTLSNTVKWGISSSIVNNMSGSIQKAWSFAKDLDESLNSIRIVSGKSADEMARFAVEANKAAKSLGAKRVIVVYSDDGYDEISPCALTHAYLIDEKGNESQFTIDPAKFGITDADEKELCGGDGAENAALGLEVLQGGGRKTIRYAVGLNAGAVMYITGKAHTLKEGYDMVLSAIDSGKALAKLKEIQEVSKSL